MKNTFKFKALAALILTAPLFANAEINNINISAILNAGITDRDSSGEIEGLVTAGEHALPKQDGFWLDHTELAFSGAVDDKFYGKLTTVLHEHDGSMEVELEEAFIQTLAMPYGLSVRAGRFLSNIGYLNSKHTHTDYFADRPVAYRGLLATHMYDDGVRLNWVAPTDLYLELGAEAFAGKSFPAKSDKTVGNTVVYVKSGDDLTDSISWQAGLAFMQTDNNQGFCSSHNHDHSGHDHAHGHAHGHAGHGHGLAEELCYEYEGAHEHISPADGYVYADGTAADHVFYEAGVANGSKDYYIADLVMKWAPNGNYKYQSLTWQTEWIQQKLEGRAGHGHEVTLTNIDPDVASITFEKPHWHDVETSQNGWYSSLVYQWSPNWSAGARYSRINVDSQYGDHNPAAVDLMLQYNFSHFSTLRLQATKDETSRESDNVISLQYSVAIGDHGAHQF